MKLKNTMLLTALIIGLNGALVANAADEKPAKDAKIEKAQPARKGKRPDNAEQNKQGTVEKAEGTCCRNPSPAGKKSFHGHH